MADTDVTVPDAAPVAAAPAKVPKKAAPKPKKPSLPAEHPKYNIMIAAAIQSLKERGGSSRQAILKYIMANYKVGSDTTKINARLKTTLKAGVKAGTLKQAKGTGASGSFRLGEKKLAADKPKKPKAARKPTKVAIAKKPKAAAKKPKAASKKPKSPKKVAAKKPKAPAKKPKSPKKPKVAKSPAKKAASKPKKPKAPKKVSKPKAAAKK